MSTIAGLAVRNLSVMFWFELFHSLLVVFPRYISKLENTSYFLLTLNFPLEGKQKIYLTIEEGHNRIEQKNWVNIQ